MKDDDRNDSARAINRALLDATLKWGVNPNRATHNPVFWHDGSLNYCDHISHREEALIYLNERGVLEPGFNGAYRLTCSLDELHAAADADYERGIDIDVVFGLLATQLEYQHSCFLKVTERGVVVEGSERTSEILENLAKLGYIEQRRGDIGGEYELTRKGEAILRARYML